MRVTKSDDFGQTGVKHVMGQLWARDTLYPSSAKDALRSVVPPPPFPPLCLTCLADCFTPLLPKESVTCFTTLLPEMLCDMLLPSCVPCDMLFCQKC